MKKFFGRKEQNYIIIDGEEINHLAVLRCKPGEQVVVYVGDELEYTTQIVEISKKFAKLEIISTQVCKGNPTKSLTLFQGLPKADKLDLVTQKLCELGASKIIPFESDFTVAKPNPTKIARLNKVSEEACKQCGRSIPLKVENAITFKQMLEQISNFDIVLFANEKERLASQEIQDKTNIAIIIGNIICFCSSCFHTF